MLKLSVMGVYTLVLFGENDAPNLFWSSWKVTKTWRRMQIFMAKVIPIAKISHI